LPTMRPLMNGSRNGPASASATDFGCSLTTRGCLLSDLWPPSSASVFCGSACCDAHRCCWACWAAHARNWGGDSSERRENRQYDRTTRPTDAILIPGFIGGNSLCLTIHTWWRRSDDSKLLSKAGTGCTYIGKTQPNSSNKNHVSLLSWFSYRSRFNIFVWILFQNF
jgi:hypothetical protein